MEQIYREYPFEESELPILPDCNNYYSGKYGDIFWHQNADQVFVFIPIPEDAERKQISAKFEAKSVEIKLNDEVLVAFQCLERIIPDGSFWLFETDTDCRKYIQLDLEKRFRMINWKGIFGGSPSARGGGIGVGVAAAGDTGGAEGTSGMKSGGDVDGDDHDPATLQSRSKILEKLFAANKGISKLSGMPPETIKEMMANGDLARMIGGEVFPEPQITTIDQDGTESSPMYMEGVEEEDNDDEEGEEVIEDKDETGGDRASHQEEVEETEENQRSYSSSNRLNMKDLRVIDADFVDAE